MIRYQLKCDQDHKFEAWFSSSEDYDVQTKRGLVSCPQCASTQIEKMLMAPQVSTSRKKEAAQIATAAGIANNMMQQMRDIRDHIHESTDDVGNKFADEARKIHYGEAEERGIRGTASQEQITELVEEGVEVAPVPVLPDEAN